MEPEEDISPDQDHPSLSQDGYEECMPNLHEDVDSEVEDVLHDDLATTPGLREQSTSKRTSTKPASATSNGPGQGTGGEECVTTHICPICSKTLQTDNRGLNAHIDFCLSKGAIREAQATASGNTSTRKLKPAASTLQSWNKRAKKRK